MKHTAVAAQSLQQALRDFTALLGSDRALFLADEDKDAYSDHFAGADQMAAHRPSAAIAPETVEEVREIVRIANRHGTPLWPISRGKNFGYGGSAPVLPGSVVLDLSRMKKIEIDERNGTVVVEPGVSFFDLDDFIQSKGLPLILSVPAQLGSVAGNALDRV